MSIEPSGFVRSPLIEDPTTTFFVVTSNTGDNVVKSVQCNAWATQRKNEQRINDAFNASKAVVLLFTVSGSGMFQGYARMRSLVGCSSIDKNPFYGFGRHFDIEWLRLHDLDIYEVQHLRNPLDGGRQVGFSRDGQELSHAVGAEVCRLIDIHVYNENPKEYEPVEDTRVPILAAHPEPGAPQITRSTSFSGPLALTNGPMSAAPPQKPPDAFIGAAPHLRGPPPPMPYQAPHGPFGPPVAHYAPPYGASPWHPPPPRPPASGPWHPPPGLHPPPGVFTATSSSGRHGRRDRRKRRRRSSSSGSDSAGEAHRLERKKSKKERDRRRKDDDEPDVSKMTYEEYTEWWKKKHGVQAQWPPAPAERAQAATPCAATNVDAAAASPVPPPANAPEPLQNTTLASSPLSASAAPAAVPSAATAEAPTPAAALASAPSPTVAEPGVAAVPPASSAASKSVLTSAVSAPTVVVAAQEKASVLSSTSSAQVSTAAAVKCSPSAKAEVKVPSLDQPAEAASQARVVASSMPTADDDTSSSDSDSDSTSSAMTDLEDLEDRRRVRAETLRAPAVTASKNAANATADVAGSSTGCTDDGYDAVAIDPYMECDDEEDDDDDSSSTSSSSPGE